MVQSATQASDRCQIASFSLFQVDADVLTNACDPGFRSTPGTTFSRYSISGVSERCADLHDNPEFRKAQFWVSTGIRWHICAISGAGNIRADLHVQPGVQTGMRWCISAVSGVGRWCADLHVILGSRRV